jgi:succinyl-CoA synthetase alpha subunit
MGTNNNKHLLADIGVSGEAIDAAGPGDLIVAVVGDSDQVVEHAIGRLDEALLATSSGAPRSSLHRLEDALPLKPAANLAVFTIPGDYVGREARKALEAGVNVFIFSSNVPPAEELELKQLARSKGLLVMGPDCGTSLVGGAGIGFANAVRRGRIGAVGPSGTGLQEFTTQVHHAGAGISHALGTGSHDLADSIGGLTTFAVLDALERDPQTDVVAVIAKPLGRKTFRQLSERLSGYAKPTVSCFLGIPEAEMAAHQGRSTVRTIDDAVHAAVDLLNGSTPQPKMTLTSDERRRAAEARRGWSARQKYVRGVFAGGTFCYQTQQLLLDRGLDVRSNAPLKPELGLADPDTSVGDTLVDMGDETYTRGRPHPMIDASLRRQRIQAEGRDPVTGILLLDFILGYNASEDPVGDLMDPILEAQRSSQAAGGQLTVVASICGTEADPQDLGMQRRLLAEAGVIVFDSSARAALFCAELLKPE